MMVFTEIETIGMTLKTPNKHEMKTKETRVLLLQAAETIFVRDGYEGAELGEIAALAGRTKGAIYAQFKSKEEVFFALVESRMLFFKGMMEAHGGETKTAEENIQALRDFYLKRVDDPAWSLLLLEFRLFAMRHPEAKKRLSKLYADIFPRDGEAAFARSLGAAGKGKNSISRVVAVQSLQPLISALVLEAQLETQLADKKVIKAVVGRIFDALLGV